ncbi:MAG: beta-galactosidase, partial [Armatimonadetes bacterium]|nr:beta-galactosidase [Armatimonadota bacterium]
AVAGQDIPFSFPNVQPLGTSVHRIEVAVLDARGEVRVNSTIVPIRYRPRPAFHLACWEESEVDYISGLWYKRFRELGMDAIFYRSDRGNRDAAARMIAEADLFGASAFAGYYPKSEPGEFGPVHKPCLHDPDYQQKSREAAHRSEPFALHDNLFYPSGSDAGMRGNCFSPPTVAAFRQWLQERYKSIGELNAAWGTQFASFDAVVPSGFDKVKSGGNVPSWVEHTRFMEQSYREHLQEVAREIKGFDPQALVGEDGYGRLNSTDGADWWNLLHDWGFVNLYTYQDPPQMEIVRSLARTCPNLKLRSLYWGSYDGQFGNQRFMRWLPWYALLHDYNGLFWWVANGKATYGSAPGIAGPDFRVTRTYQTSLNEIEDIRRGIAELIQPAQRRHDGVAIFYDQTAVHAVTAYKHPSALVGAYTVFQDLFTDLGLQYDYVAGAQVEQGILPEQGYRVLVMAQALALSDAAAAQIRDFVNKGGMIVADVRPGQYDSLLRPAANGSLLADMFGAAGETKAVGRGFTHLLADWPARYHHQRTDKAAQEARDKLQAILQPLKLAPPVTFAGADGARPPGLETAAYEHDGTIFVGLLNDSAKAISGEAHAARPARVYDVRAHADLGATAAWPVALEPGETKLFALCPYEVTGMQIKAAKGAVVAGQPWQAQVQVQAQGGPPNAAHSFVVEVTDPAGQAHPLYGQAVAAGAGGVATISLPFALNDAPGPWRVRVTETVSGKSAEAVVTVAAPKG